MVGSFETLDTLLTKSRVLKSTIILISSFAGRRYKATDAGTINILRVAAANAGTARFSDFSQRRFGPKLKFLPKLFAAFPSAKSEPRTQNI